MSNISRHKFLKQSINISALALVNPFGNNINIKNSHYLFPKINNKNSNTLLTSICRANDIKVEQYLLEYHKVPGPSRNRGQSGFLLALSAAYCAKDSKFYRSENLIGPMQNLVEKLISNQRADGTFDSGNLGSPPDSAFMVEQFFRIQAILQQDNSDKTSLIRQNMKKLILNTGEALITGGVHTPNHRWAICAALAGTNSLYPDQRYVNRIEEWLSEGIGQDSDGQHPERSPNYDSAVNNPSLLDTAIYLNRPELLDFVRRNLEMTIYLMELNGEVETVASRRQDQAQGRSRMIHAYYLPYRYLAIKDKNPRFENIARLIESRYMNELGSHLSDFLLHKELNNSLPEVGELPDNYLKHLKNTGLVRIRRGNKTATIFGGSDWHLGHGVWSGLSTNPTFFKFRNGEAILDSLRMSASFFQTGYFRSNGLTVNDKGFYLQEERKIPYHQPLPKQYRNNNGDYKMSPDGRFFSKMDFENRPKDFKTLNFKVSIKEIKNSASFELNFLVDQTPNVAVAIELCFRKGGELSGVISRENDPDGYYLSDGYGTYRVGDDKIEFGPGKKEHSGFTMYNEQYSVHNGKIHEEGYRVYIYGTTPFNYNLKIG